MMSLSFAMPKGSDFRMSSCTLTRKLCACSDIARAAAQPAGKVATDEDLSAPFRPDTSGGIPDSQHVDPLAQVIRLGISDV